MKIKHVTMDTIKDLVSRDATLRDIATAIACERHANITMDFDAALALYNEAGITARVRRRILWHAEKSTSLLSDFLLLYLSAKRIEKAAERMPYFCDRFYETAHLRRIVYTKLETAPPGELMAVYKHAEEEALKTYALSVLLQKGYDTAASLRKYDIPEAHISIAAIHPSMADMCKIESAMIGAFNACTGLSGVMVCDDIRLAHEESTEVFGYTLSKLIAVAKRAYVRAIKRETSPAVLEQCCRFLKGEPLGVLALHRLMQLT